jgi:hypothetical protein
MASTFITNPLAHGVLENREFAYKVSKCSFSVDVTMCGLSPEPQIESLPGCSQGEIISVGPRAGFLGVCLRWGALLGKVVEKHDTWWIAATIRSRDLVEADASHREDNLTLLFPLGIVDSFIWPGSVVRAPSASAISS